jgi:hypothetical protein
MSKKKVDVTVMVNDDHKDKLAEVARALKVKGFVLAESLGAIGALTGSVPANALSDLSAVPGVSAVEENRTDYRTQQGES